MLLLTGFFLQEAEEVSLFFFLPGIFTSHRSCIGNQKGVFMFSVVDPDPVGSA
jgi:hypothetical protein